MRNDKYEEMDAQSFMEQMITIEQRLNGVVRTEEDKFVIVQEVCQTYEWLQTAGRDGKAWVFADLGLADKIAKYMNSPHYDYYTWKHTPDLGWYVRTLKEFKALGGSTEPAGFVDVPDFVAAEIDNNLVEMYEMYDEMKAAGCMEPITSQELNGGKGVTECH